MIGDQRNLKVHGACARVISPTTLMSTPMLRSQSGMAIHTRPSGSPDEKESSETDAVRHERIASHRLRNVPGRCAAAWVGCALTCTSPPPVDPHRGRCCLARGGPTGGFPERSEPRLERVRD